MQFPGAGPSRHPGRPGPFTAMQEQFGRWNIFLNAGEAAIMAPPGTARRVYACSFRSHAPDGTVVRRTRHPPAVFRESSRVDA
jgi:hypothetical protein